MILFIIFIILLYLLYFIINIIQSFVNPCPVLQKNNKLKNMKKYNTHLKL